MRDDARAALLCVLLFCSSAIFITSPAAAQTSAALPTATAIVTAVSYKPYGSSKPSAPVQAAVASKAVTNPSNQGNCTSPTPSPSNHVSSTEELPALEALQSYLVLSSKNTCKDMTTTPDDCYAAVGALKSLVDQAENASVRLRSCALDGKKNAKPLPSDDVVWDSARAKLWELLAAAPSSDKVAYYSGSYKLSSSLIDALLVPFNTTPPASATTPATTPVTPATTPATTPAPITPKIVAKQSEKLPYATKQFLVQGQPIDANYSSSVVSVCSWSAVPAFGVSLDCTAKGSKNLPLSLAPLADGTQPTSMALDGGGKATVTLATPLSAGQFISLVQVSTLANKSATTPTSTTQTSTTTSISTYGVLAANQCNSKPLRNTYSDCDLVFSLIGGIEQAALASQPSTTDGFLRVFTRAGTNYGTYAWAEVRLLSAPQQSSTTGVVSAFSDPSGNIQTNTFSNVGNSIDYMIGAEQILASPRHGAYTASLIAGFGGTTPLSSTSLAQAFTAPAFGTVECNQLYTKFAAYFASAPYNVIKGAANQATGTTAGSTASACLLNTNSPTTTGTGTGAVTTYAPINTIGFSNQDSHNILGKYEFGIRTIDRFIQPGMKACGDLDVANRIAPCQRGTVDFTVGADASITGGVFRKWIYKVEAVHPLPIKGTAYLYLFGSFSMRFQRNESDAPLILQTASTSTLTGTGTTAVPNVNTVVLPLVQPNRDFYRFGIGVDISCIFTKIFSASSSCAPSSTSAAAPAAAVAANP